MKFNSRRVGSLPYDVGTSDVLRLVILQAVFKDLIQHIANNEEIVLPTLERWLEDTVHKLHALMW